MTTQTPPDLAALAREIEKQTADMPRSHYQISPVCFTADEWDAILAALRPHASAPGEVERLRELSEKAAKGPWYVAPARREDGLAEIEDGRQHGMFPVRGEWPEIEFIVPLVNWFRSLEEKRP